MPSLRGVSKLTYVSNRGKSIESTGWREMRGNFDTPSGVQFRGQSLKTNGLAFWRHGCSSDGTAENRGTAMC